MSTANAATSSWSATGTRLSRARTSSGWTTSPGGAAALDAWDYAFAQVLDTTLEAAGQAEPQAGEDLDLAGHGIALVTELFLGRRAGVPVTQLSQSLKSAALAEVPPDAAERQW